MMRPILCTRGRLECPSCARTFKDKLAYDAHRIGDECADSVEMRACGLRARDGVWQVSVPATVDRAGAAISADPLPGDSP